jgi:hypothetical protein
MTAPTSCAPVTGKEMPRIFGIGRYGTFDVAAVFVLNSVLLCADIQGGSASAMKTAVAKIARINTSFGNLSEDASPPLRPGDGEATAGQKVIA